MRILIYSLNFLPELTGTGKYVGEMAAWLDARGYEIRVVTAPPYYPNWKIYDGFYASRYVAEQSGNFEIYRCPIYVPAKPSLITRMLHLLSFAVSSLPKMLCQWIWHPEVVIVIVPTLFCAPQATLLAKLTRSLSIIHIQDFEVDAMFGLDMARGGLVRRLSTSLERLILCSFDRVSTISSGMLKRAQAKGVAIDRLRLLPNWSEVGHFRGVERSPELLESLGVDPMKRVVLYSGNLGEKQGLEIIVDCARAFQGNENIVFLVVGTGTGRHRLMELVRSSELNNIVFAPLQPYESLPALLASADCHLVIQRRGAADAVMPSKLTNILAAGGNAVITADPDTSLGELCRDFDGIATLVEPESLDDLLYGIEIALDRPKPNRIAQAYAEQYLDKDQILQPFFDEIEADIAARQQVSEDKE